MMTDATRSAYKPGGAGSEAKRIWSAGIPAQRVAPSRCRRGRATRGEL